MVQNKFIDTLNLKIPQTVSIYQAVRYIAFKEKLVDNFISNQTYSQKELSEEEKSNCNDAANALLISLKQGDIKANATMLHRKHKNLNKEDVKIPPLAWVHFDIDWHKGELNNLNVPKDDYQTYEGIYVDVKTLKSKFPLNDSKISNRGAPPKFDWESFYVQTTFIANTPDGLPETQAELEKVMAEWCDNNWPETPSETSLKDKIRFIYQRDKKDNN